MIIMGKSKSFIKSQAKLFVLLFIKQFTVPLIIIAVIMSLGTYFTDILDIGEKNKDTVDMKSELAYYNQTYDENATNSLITSAWDYVTGVFSTTELKWPLPGRTYISSNYRT